MSVITPGFARMRLIDICTSACMNKLSSQQVLQIKQCSRMEPKDFCSARCGKEFLKLPEDEFRIFAEQLSQNNEAPAVMAYTLGQKLAQSGLPAGALDPCEEPQPQLVTDGLSEPVADNNNGMQFELIPFETTQDINFNQVGWTSAVISGLTILGVGFTFLKQYGSQVFATMGGCFLIQIRTSSNNQEPTMA